MLLEEMIKYEEEHKKGGTVKLDRRGKRKNEQYVER
jgi:hypothetical protein